MPDHVGGYRSGMSTDVDGQTLLGELLERHQSASRTVTVVGQLSSLAALPGNGDRPAIVEGFTRVAGRGAYPYPWSVPERLQVSAALRGALPTLARLAGDPDPAVRRVVPDAICAIGTDDPAIVAALRDQADRETDDMALARQVRALDELRHHEGRRTVVAGATPADWFVRLLRHRSTEVRLAVVAVLARRGPSDDDAGRLADAAVESATEPVLSADAHRWLDSAWPYQSRPSLELLAVRLVDRPERCTRLALAGFGSTDANIRRAAVAVAGEVVMHWRTPMNALWAAAAAGLADVDILVSMHSARLLGAGGHAVRPFADALMDKLNAAEDSTAAVEAAVALAHIGDDRVLPTLVQWITTGPYWGAGHLSPEVLDPFRDRAGELLPAMRARMRTEYLPTLAAWVRRVLKPYRS